MAFDWFRFSSIVAYVQVVDGVTALPPVFASNRYAQVLAPLPVQVTVKDCVSLGAIGKVPVRLHVVTVGDVCVHVIDVTLLTPRFFICIVTVPLLQNISLASNPCISPVIMLVMK